MYVSVCIYFDFVFIALVPIALLFISTAGVADQLQSNFATDLRAILKVVFQINASQDEEEEEEAEEEAATTSKAASESSSVEEAMEAQECFIEEPDDNEEEGSSELPSLFPLPIEESPSRQASKLEGLILAYQ